MITIQEYNFKNLSKDSSYQEVNNKNSYYDSDIQKIKKEAFNSGYNNAAQEVTKKLQSEYENKLKKTEQEMSLQEINACTNLQNKLEKYLLLLKEHNEIKKEHISNEISELAMTIGNKLSHSILKKDNFTIVQQFLKEHMQTLYNKSHLTFTINKKLKNFLLQKNILSNFITQIKIVEDDMLQNNDCKIDWSDGGIHFIRNEKMKQLGEIFTLYHALKKNNIEEKQ